MLSGWQLATSPTLDDCIAPPGPAAQLDAVLQAVVENELEGEAAAAAAQKVARPALEATTANGTTANGATAAGQAEPAPPTARARFLPAALVSLLAGAVARAEAALLRGLRAMVDATPPGSWLWRAFAAVATGPLRPAVLRLYAKASDHTRRLRSVKANSKFSHPDAGPEHPLNVRGRQGAGTAFSALASLCSVP